jgi:UDP-N-acetylglucosamine 2-epimerase (non-hydrolysing)
VFGTRPEAIKMVPLVKAFQSNNNYITKVCVTGQHRQMLDQVLGFFQIRPDYDLNLMKPNQTLLSITTDVLMKIQPVLEEFMPDNIWVQGDTTTVMSAFNCRFL